MISSVARWLSPLGALKLALLGWTLRATRDACARVSAALAEGGGVVYAACCEDRDPGLFLIGRWLVDKLVQWLYAARGPAWAVLAASVSLAVAAGALACTHVEPLAARAAARALALVRERMRLLAPPAPASAPLDAAAAGADEAGADARSRPCAQLALTWALLCAAGMRRLVERVETVASRVGACTSFETSPAPHAAPVQRGESGPDILFVLADDLNTDIGTFRLDKSTYSGARADAFARPSGYARLRDSAHAVEFINAHAHAAICAPSRFSLLVGRALPSTSMRLDDSILNDWRFFVRGATPLPEHFRKHGYRVLGAGKLWHSSGPCAMEAASWDECVRTRSDFC